MNKYELTVVVNAKIEDDERAQVIEKVKDLVTRFGGNVTDVDEWGKRRLAYEIQKMKEAYYYFIHFESDATVPGEVEERIRIMDNVLRYLCVKDEAQKKRGKRMNKVILMGRLTRDPEVRYSAGENSTAVARYTLAVDRRDLLQQFDCLVCNELEAGIFFAENYSKKSPKDLCEIIYQKVSAGAIKSMVVTMGSKGSIYADHLGNKGICPAKKVTVRDTTGAGDAFCAGLTIGLTYRKDLSDAVEIGTKLAASVITSSENVCPRFLPRELGLDMDVSDC